MTERIPARPVSISIERKTIGLPNIPPIPPVPERRDSLTPPLSDSDLELEIKAPLRTSTPVIESMALVETLLTDDPHVLYTFEAKGLWKDSYKQLYEFYQNKQLCDVEIKVGRRSIKCHRVVLACVSRYFRSMFTSEMAESRKPVVTIQDIDENALELLVRFAYTAKIDLTIENVQSLLYASSILQMETVAHACCDFMKTHLHPSNCIGIRTFAEQHGRNELMKMADQFIYDSFAPVVESEEFVSMTPKHLESLVASQDLNVDCEVQVYEAVIKWVKHDIITRRKHLATLISKVKLPLLPATYLMEKVATEDLLRRDLDCRDLVDEAKYYQLSLASVVPDVKFSERMRPRKSCAGVIFCVGGRGASGDPFKSIECYDLRRDRWFQVAELSCRRRHVGVVSVSGRLFAVGGHDGAEHLSSGEVFDPTNNKWKAIAPMATPRRGIALACLGGPIYAVGGLDDSTCYNIVERYDPESDTWSFVQAMIMPRGGVAVTALKGYLYAIGGNDGATSLESCERYDPHLNKWSMVASMNKRRAGAGVAELNGQLYVIGGFDDNSPLESVEKYDPKTNTWKMLARMSCPRGGVGVAALGGKIYAVGGHDGSSYLNSVEAYDPLSNTWSPVRGISLCRAGAGVSFCDAPLNRIRAQLGQGDPNAAKHVSKSDDKKTLSSSGVSSPLSPSGARVLQSPSLRGAPPPMANRVVQLPAGARMPTAYAAAYAGTRMSPSDSSPGSRVFTLPIGARVCQLPPGTKILQERQDTDVPTANSNSLSHSMEGMKLNGQDRPSFKISTSVESNGSNHEKMQHVEPSLEESAYADVDPGNV